MRTFNLSIPLGHAKRGVCVRSSDLLLLCCGELPRWDARRGCVMPQMHHRFLLVNVISAREGSSVVTVTAYLPDGSPMLQPAARQSAWFAVLLGMSLIPAKRVWDSISKTDSATRVSKRVSKIISVTQDVLRINRQVINCYQFRASQTPYFFPHFENENKFRVCGRMDDAVVVPIYRSNQQEPIRSPFLRSQKQPGPCSVWKDIATPGDLTTRKWTFSKALSQVCSPRMPNVT